MSSAEVLGIIVASSAAAIGAACAVPVLAVQPLKRYALVYYRRPAVSWTIRTEVISPARPPAATPGRQRAAVVPRVIRGEVTSGKGERVLRASPRR